MTDDARDGLKQILDSARTTYANRRGSPEARKHADKLERAYVELGGDTETRRQFAAVVEWLRNPDA